MMLVFVLLIFHLDKEFSHANSLDPLNKSCTPKSCLLNDCNWCECDEKGRYQCAARSCGTVDMFGHFQDAIADINVGMEGKGSWRSSPTACIPGAHYGRDGLLCICNENGEWPNPVCRDIFRILYSVEPVSPNAVTEKQACTQNKLYLMGCHVCVCSKGGYLDENLCTDIVCRVDDPLNDNNKQISELNRSTTVDEEIYATCNIHKEYYLGCRKCTCLRNNRLMCNNCAHISDNSYCENKKVNEIFNIDCNFCQCDDMKNMYCTTNKCLRSESKDIDKIKRNRGNDKKICTVREYGGSCKSCECVDNGKGQYELECSTECDSNFTIHNGCVTNSVYEKDCLICFCYKSPNDGLEICNRNPLCDAEDGLQSKPLKDLRTTHGGCEPFRTYRKDCNVCNCLADGKTLNCTSTRCDQENTKVKMVPIILKEGGNCPVGSMYYQYCNICICQENNKSLCTTLPCDRINRY